MASISGNHHTPLISHTATDILTALTGAYGDRMGVPVPTAMASSGRTVPSAFAVRSSIGPRMSRPTASREMINENGKTLPAPWVPFTRAGCDVGASRSPIWSSRACRPMSTPYSAPGSPAGRNDRQLRSLTIRNDDNFAHQKARQSVNTDWLGIAVHCAQGSPLCSSLDGAPDLLPDEPDGYTGFNALFGNINVAPVICVQATRKSVGCDAQAGHVRDVSGTPSSPTPSGARASRTSSARRRRSRSAMRRPCSRRAYRSSTSMSPMRMTAIRCRSTRTRAVPPPLTRSVRASRNMSTQLKAYDQAFGTFFARLAADGITKDNTLFCRARRERPLRR